MKKNDTKRWRKRRGEQDNARQLWIWLRKRNNLTQADFTMNPDRPKSRRWGGILALGQPSISAWENGGALSQEHFDTVLKILDEWIAGLPEKGWQNKEHTVYCDENFVNRIVDPRNTYWLSQPANIRLICQRCQADYPSEPLRKIETLLEKCWPEQNKLKKLHLHCIFCGRGLPYELD